MWGLGRRSCRVLTAVWLVAGCSGFARSAPVPTYLPPLPDSSLPLRSYSLGPTLGLRKEWRFQPLVIDLNGDGHLDLVATARLVKPSLHIWSGDGSINF